MSTRGTVGGRGRAIGDGVTWTARWSLRLVLVSAGAVLLWLLIAALWSVVLPTLLAVILATVLWPPTAWLRRHRFPPAVAAATVLLGGVLVLAGLITLISTSVSGSISQIVTSATTGIQAIRDWLSGPPLNLGQSQLDEYISQATAQLQQSVSTIATSVVTGVGGVASGVVTGLLTLVLAFLFVKDGPRFLPWVRTVAGGGAGSHIAEVLRRIWKTLGDFIRTQAIVSLVDSVLIGAGLFILGVPLALPLAVLTFLAGFVPIVGAIVAGALGVLVALVSNGFTTALIVLAIIVAVQQIEGNVLQPMLQSRSLGLHSAVVLLAVTGGSTLYGIAGAFLAVPAAAGAAVIVRYLGERLDERTGVAGTADASAAEPGPATYPEGPEPPEDETPGGPTPGDPTPGDGAAEHADGAGNDHR